MDSMGSIVETSDITEGTKVEHISIKDEMEYKFRKMMGDDKIEANNSHNIIGNKKTLGERENKFSKLFDLGDFFVEKESENSYGDFLDKFDKKEKASREIDIQNSEDDTEEPDYSEKREPKSTYEINGDLYETDDNGNIYKKNRKLLPNIEYTINGNRYKTDENVNIVSCDSEPKHTEDGERNQKEQKESGGEYRQEEDDGGHIVARILGGAEGEENLVPMRRTINRGDYKKMENIISKALQEEKKVTLQVELEYDENSHRPSKIKVEYIIDGETTTCEFDNVEASTELLDSLKDKISDEDFERLSQLLDDMKEDGNEIAITSVNVVYDENVNPTKVTVGVLNETTREKTYKENNPR